RLSAILDASGAWADQQSPTPPALCLFGRAARDKDAHHDAIPEARTRIFCSNGLHTVQARDDHPPFIVHRCPSRKPHPHSALQRTPTSPPSTPSSKAPTAATPRASAGPTKPISSTANAPIPNR